MKLHIIVIAIFLLFGCSNSNKNNDDIKFVNLNKKKITFEEKPESETEKKNNSAEPILYQKKEVWQEFNKSYEDKLNENINNSDYTKYTVREKGIYNYMQSIWDDYELQYGITKAEQKVFTKTAEKYNISKQEVLRIFNKVDKTIFEY